MARVQHRYTRPSPRLAPLPARTGRSEVAMDVTARLPAVQQSVLERDIMSSPHQLSVRMIAGALHLSAVELAAQSAVRAVAGATFFRCARRAGRTARSLSVCQRCAAEEEQNRCEETA